MRPLDVEAEVPGWAVYQDGEIGWKATHTRLFPLDGICVCAQDPVELLARIRNLERVYALAMDRGGRVPARVPNVSREPDVATVAPRKPTARAKPDTPGRAPVKRPAAQAAPGGVSGLVCHNCHGSRVMRTGTCGTCLDCGESTGCG